MNALVPVDILDVLDGAPERCCRIYVTAWALSRGLPELGDAAFDRAYHIWDGQDITKPGRMSALDVLVELEALGHLSVVSADDDGILVRLEEENVL